MNQELQYHLTRCSNGRRWIRKNFPNISEADLMNINLRESTAPLYHLVNMLETIKDVESVKHPVDERPLAVSLRAISGQVTTHKPNYQRNLDLSYVVARAHESQQFLESTLSLPFTGTIKELYCA